MWKAEAVRAMEENGGSISVKEAVEWFHREYPVLLRGKPNHTFKIRVALQRAGMRVCPNCGQEHRRPAWVKGVKAKPVKNCVRCGTRLPPVWTVKPELRTREPSSILNTVQEAQVIQTFQHDGSGNMSHFAFVMKVDETLYPTAEEAEFLRDFTEDSDDYRVVSLEDLKSLSPADKRKFKDVIAALKGAIEKAEREGNGAITVAIS